MNVEVTEPVIADEAIELADILGDLERSIPEAKPADSTWPR